MSPVAICSSPLSRTEGNVYILCGIWELRACVNAMWHSSGVSSQHRCGRTIRYKEQVQRTQQRITAGLRTTKYKKIKSNRNSHFAPNCTVYRVEAKIFMHSLRILYTPGSKALQHKNPLFTYKYDGSPPPQTTLTAVLLDSTNWSCN
jgi:hypothetical protein